MSERKNIPQKTKIALVAKSGGICEFLGCNENLFEDDVTKTQINFSEMAHIIASSPKGTRGDEELSPKLQIEESNIMLLCPKHHKMVDEDGKKYSKEKLTEMKVKHEKYIKKLKNIKKDRGVVVVIYRANVSNRIYTFTPDDIDMSLYKQDYYEQERICFSGCIYDEGEEDYYNQEVQYLKQQYDIHIKQRQKDEAICNKYLLYAFAPQPLLIYIGMLFSDISNVEVQQLQRLPIREWYLISNAKNSKIEYKIYEPQEIKSKKIALNLSITANISDDRIKETLGEDVDIWKIESNIHGNDIIKNKSDIDAYRKVIFTVYEDIKDKYGRNCEINIFPAMPIAIAVETGRVWMKKSHPKLIIYDEKNGFKKCLEIEGGK